LEERERVGNTVGVIYALASIGSIIGTFLSGFVLIPFLGIKAILFLVAFIIAFLALLARSARLVTLVWLVCIVVIYVLLSRGVFGSWHGSQRDDSVEAVYITDSQYSHIEVLEGYYRGKKERVLVMDGLIHNRYNPLDPDDLIYEYVKIFSAITDHMVTNVVKTASFSTLSIGGGACLFPAYLDRRYPESENEIVEIDPEVVRIAHRYFDLQENPRLKITIADARSYVNSIHDSRKFDLVFLDAFSSYSVPTHLTTREFAQDVANILSPKGALIVNVVDVFSIGKFLAAYITTLERIFPNVSVFSGSNFTPERRNTFVLLASFAEISLENTRDKSDQFMTSRIDAYEIERLKSRQKYLELTDDYAPVENLIAPVFIHSVE
jgi:spermidine synthase